MGCRRAASPLGDARADERLKGRDVFVTDPRPEHATAADVRWLEGEPLTALLDGFRDSVRAELLQGEISPGSVEVRADEVFRRWLEARPGIAPSVRVEDSLRQIARALAGEVRRQARRSRIRDDGFFGSGY